MQVPDQARPWANRQITPTPQRPPPYNNAPLNEWKYDMRRNAQLIIPGLYLGPQQVAMNSQKMRDLGITHVLCVRDKKETRMVYERFPETYRYYVMEISEDFNEKIIRLIPDCMKFIDQAISSGGTVLAHCLSGMNLSPALVIAYIMTKYNWNFDQTLSFVQGKRYCVSPTNFEHQLREYEPIYKAIQIYGQMPLGTRLSKREFEEDDDDEVLERNPGRILLGNAETVVAVNGDIDM